MENQFVITQCSKLAASSGSVAFAFSECAC